MMKPRQLRLLARELAEQLRTLGEPPTLGEGDTPRVVAWEDQFESSSGVLKRLAGHDGKLLRRACRGMGDDVEIGRGLLTHAALLAEGHTYTTTVPDGC